MLFQKLKHVVLLVDDNFLRIQNILHDARGIVAGLATDVDFAEILVKPRALHDFFVRERELFKPRKERTFLVVLEKDKVRLLDEYLVFPFERAGEELDVVLAGGQEKGLERLAL